MTERILLTQGKYALIDDEDYDFLNQWKWHAFAACNTFYAAHKIYCCNGKNVTILMHNTVMNESINGFECDHIDGNGLNNQRNI